MDNRDSPANVVNVESGYQSGLTKLETAAIKMTAAILSTGHQVNPKDIVAAAVMNAHLLFDELAGVEADRRINNG